MNDSFAPGFFLGIFAGLLLGCFLDAITNSDPGTIKTLRAEAVKRGHAEWVVNPETGETVWEWKPKDI